MKIIHPCFTSLRAVCLATSVMLAVSACASAPALPEDPLAGDHPLWMVPVNPTDRWAINMVVDGYGVGDANPHADGGAAACCYPGPRGRVGKQDWPPPQPRKRTAYEDLIVAAWDIASVVPPAVDGFLAEHVHDSVAHFTSWPCALYDPRGVYCDQVRYYAARPWLGPRPVVVS